jgi:hypothetical protein
MPTPKKLNRKAPMSIMQQFGDNERGRSLQREGQRRPGASRSAGDEANMLKYRTMRYVEGERSQGRRASYEQGGEVKGGGTIKIAGQYAVDSIKTTPEGNQYVSMELPDGKVVPVFGDWETYGNPDKERRIEDLDYIIYPLGDGTYALDAAEAEAEMVRDEARGVAREAVGGMGASPTEDLLERLSQRRGMGFTPSGRMRPVRRQ